MTKLFRRLAKEEEGQGMVEYALILVFVSIVVVAALGLVGNSVANALNNVKDKFPS